MGASKDLTLKQQKYVDGKLSGLSDIDSYRAAGYVMGKNKNITYVACSKLNSNPKIKLRLKEIKDKAEKKLQKKFEYTKEQSFNNLEKMRILALMVDDNGKNQISAAIKAEELKGKIAGLYVEKSENKNLNINGNFEEWAKGID